MKIVPTEKNWGIAPGVKNLQKLNHRKYLTFRYSIITHCTSVFQVKQGTIMPNLYSTMFFEANSFLYSID